MKDKGQHFNEAWARLINGVKQEAMLREATSEDATPCPNCGQVHPPEDVVMVMTFQFTPGLSQDDLLDGISNYLKHMLADADFRKTMRWPADAPPASPQAPSAPESVPADDYAKPRYCDYVGRPDDFDAAKAAWRRRMTMMGFDPNVIP